MKNSKFLVLSILGFLLFYSCAPIYIPNAHNIPQVDKKGEAQGGAVLGSNGFDLMGSYALSDNQALMASISGPLSTEEDDNRHIYFEGGYGIFNRNPNWLRMSAFAGMGAGAAHGQSSWSSPSGTTHTQVANGTYLKPFLQGNVGIHSPVVDVGLSSRLGYVAFSYADINGQQVEEPLASIMFEPAAYISLGWKIVKIYGYGGASYATAENVGFDYFPFMFGLGTQIMINQKGE